MASSNPNDEVQALEVGIDVRSLDKSSGSPWVQNVLYRNGRYESRPGFGTVAQYSTTLTGGRDTAIGNGGSYGYGDLLGCHSLVTANGHRQIVSVHQLYAYTGDEQTDTAGDPSRRAQYLNLFAANVYDIELDSRVEFVLHQGTQELSNSSIRNLTTVVPHYQQFDSKDTPFWVVSQAATASFVTINGVVYVIIDGFGVWQYRPVEPLNAYTPNRMMPVNGADSDMIGARSYGESSAWQRLVFTDGYYTNSYVYVSDSEMPKPSAACNYLNRLVLASGRRVFISDPDQPNHFIADNQFVIPSEFPITAIAEIKGVLVIYTSHEVWMYNPSTGDTIIAGGRIYNVSRSIGCLSPRHVAYGDDALYWVDERGVYANSGGMEITRLSAPLDPWFSQPEAMQNPGVSYQVASGFTNVGAFGFDQPRVRIDLVGQLKPKYGNVAWDQQNRRLLVTARDLTLIWSNDASWAIWLYETSCNVTPGVTPTPNVGLTRNIVYPQLLIPGGGDDTFMVGGPDEQEYSDDFSLPVNNYAWADKSFYILRMGRGGSLDRSSAKQEDRRSVNGNWTRKDGYSGNATFYIGRPVGPMPVNYDSGYNVNPNEVWLLPVYLSGPLVATTSFTLHFTVDPVRWQVITIPPTVVPSNVGEIDAVIPSERVASQPGYKRLTGVMTATEEIRLYNGVNPSYTGSSVHIAWNGAAVANTWRHHPNMNLNRHSLNPIAYIPVTRKTGTTSGQSTVRIVTEITNASLNGVPSPSAAVYVWDESYRSQPEQDLSNDSHAQPQDWVLKTRRVGDGKQQILARGVFITMQSQGSATNKFVPGWIWGPLNTVTGSDNRDWSAQTIDYQGTGLDDIANKVPIRARIRPALTNQMYLKTGNNVARWGDVNFPVRGNLLIDDPAVDTIATSEGVRGESISVMALGTLNHPAETIKIQSVSILLRDAGGRRRSGR